GAVLEATPSMVVAGGVQRVHFLREAEAINRHVKTLQNQGVEAIVVTIHQGGPQPPYAGPTRAGAPGPTEGIAEVIAELDDAVDVVVSGHAHAFTNALMKNKHGHEILVTQAWLGGGAFAAIELTIDKQTRDVVSKSASIIPTYNDAGPGLSPALDVAALVKRVDAHVAPLTARVIGTASTELPQKPNDAGESALGNLIADAQRVVSGVQIAWMNQGGIRTGLDQGEITWGELFAIQPFSNTIVTMDLTGAQVQRVLEQQWLDGTTAHVLHVSGLAYRWSPAGGVGKRVLDVRLAGVPLLPAAVYRVAVNSFLAGGGGGFAVLREGKNQRTGPVDLDVLVQYIEQLGKPVDARIEGRIRTP
ncbi:MAG: ushA, partial [Myxococcaceae bacterium]|nr:ushA [Myxococcaceae bacterium]